MIGQWDKTHATSENAPNTLAQLLCSEEELQFFDTFNYTLKDCGLFGISVVFEGHDIDDVCTLTQKIQRKWKHLCTAVDDDEIDRARNQYRTNLFTALETNVGLAQRIAEDVRNFL